MAPPTPPIVVSSDDFKPPSFQRSDTVTTFEDDVRGFSQEIRMRLAPNDETGSYDPDFRRSKVDDLNDCVNDEDRRKLADYLPDKISFEARNRWHDAWRRGDEDECDEALEHGVELLSNKLGDGFDQWRFQKIGLLLDLGHDEEARSLLNREDSSEWDESQVEALEFDLAEKQTRSTRTSDQQYLQRPSQVRRASTYHSDVAYTDAEYQKMVKLDLWRQKLDLAIRAEEWGQVEATQRDLHGLDPGYFDVEKPLERFEKIRQLLNVGQLRERSAKEAGDKLEKWKSLEDALRFYNYGCYATELYHRQYDTPFSVVYDYDHIDCANLFFSAARVCITIQDDPSMTLKGRPILPKNCNVEPSLTEPTWSKQALYFLEQGRSRALLDSIVRGEEFMPLLQRRLIDKAIESVVYAAHASIRIKKRDSMAPESPSSSSVAVSPTETPVDAFRLPPNASPVFMQAIGKNRRANTVHDIVESPISLDSDSSAPKIPPLTTERSPRGSFTDEQMRRLRVQMRWRRAKLYAFSEINPTFKSALAALPNSSSSIKSFREMSQSIPPNTIIIEYGLPVITSMSAPRGLVTVVISSENVEAALWKESDTKEIRALVRALRRKMSDEYAMVRRDAPSPISPKSARSLPDFDDRTIAELRTSLHDHLIAPVESVLRKKLPDRIIVVPSGELAHVPWGMLLDVPFTIVPSLSIWNRLHELSADPVGIKPNVSVFSNKPKDEDGVSRDIPFSRVEALYLSWLHDHSQRPHLADDINRKTFEQFSKSMDVLHLCAHSSFDDVEPMHSTVQLFREPWSMTQWRELAIKSHIVVFSSCLSAISKAYDSGGGFGFAHTLLATGTRAFVGSLWPVEDEPTLLLMMLFYEELRASRMPVDALHNAQSKLRALTQQQFWELIEMLRRMFKDVGVEDGKTYVTSPRTWLRILERYDVAKLREPRNWAAFVLTGYGFRAIYPKQQQDQSPS